MLGAHLAQSCWSCQVFYSRPHLKGLQTWLPIDVAFKHGFAFGLEQDVVPTATSQQFKKGNSDHPFLTVLFQLLFSHFLPTAAFSWLWETTLSSTIFSAWENATLLASLLPSSWLCFSTPVAVYCCTGTARFEEEGKSFGISSYLISPVFWSVRVSFCSPLTCSKERTTKLRTLRDERISNGTSLSMCFKESWWELEDLGTLLWASVSCRLGLVNSFSLLYSATALNLVPYLESMNDQFPRN